MPESDDKQELRGLARSIDALFVGPSRATESSSAVSTSPDGPSASELPSEPEGPVAPELLEQTPPTEVMESAAGRALDDVVESPEPLGPVDRAESEEAIAPVEALGDEPGEVWDSPWSTPDAAPATVGSDDADPHEFALAVQRFLAGERGAADELREMAAGLRERLALDPLADAVELLVRRAEEPPDTMILEMATAITNPAVASRLVQRIGQERDEARKSEYKVLCQRVGRVMAEAFRGALSDSTDRHARRAYYDMLIAMGETSRPIIEGMVDDDNRFLVRNAVAILGETGGGRAVELVTSSLANSDPRVRREALQSLAKLGSEDADQLVMAFLDDTDSGVRIAAAEAAGELGVARALRPLLAMLEGERDPDAVVPVLRALGQIGDPGAVRAIEKLAVRTLFSTPPTQTRIAAYRALGRIGTPHASELVRGALADKDTEVRAAVRELMTSR